MDGGARWCATGLENRADRKVVGSTPEPSANFCRPRMYWRHAGELKPRTIGAGCRSGDQAPDMAHTHETLVQIQPLQPITGRLGIGEPKAL
jgi:hypothetical protein